MASIRTWSTSAASNNQATPDGWPEAMAPSAVNDTARETHAAIRTWYQDAEWIDWGHAPTRVSDTQFSVPTDQTAVYLVNRRVRVVGATTGYGTISASSYGAPNTTVTVSPWDSGVTPTSPTTVSVGILTPTNLALPANAVLTGTAQTITGIKTFSATPVFSANATFSSGLTVTAGTALYNGNDIGPRNIPPNAQAGNYTLVAGDSGGSVVHASGAGAGDTYTIPANASVAFVTGTAVTFINLDSNAITIAITTDTMTLAGTTTTGSRTLGQNGIATAVKVTATSWLISGTALT